MGFQGLLVEEPTQSKRRRRLRRAVPSIVCVAGAVVLLAIIGGNRDVDQGNLFAIPALALMFTAVTQYAWRAPALELGDGAATRLRRLHRRWHLRIGILVFYACFVFWYLASYAHFEGTDEYMTTDTDAATAHYNTYTEWAVWLLWLCLVPVVVQPFTWRLWPSAVRNALRREQIARAVDGGTDWSSRTRGYEPELGAMGRPPAIKSVEAGEPSTKPVTLKADRDAAKTALAHGSKARGLPDWAQRARIRWSGESLEIVDGWGRESRLAVHHQTGSPQDVVEVVYNRVRQSTVYTNGRRTPPSVFDKHASRIYFLDADGRQVARMRMLGFSTSEVARLAKASGLAFREYETRNVNVGTSFTSLADALFPKRGDTIDLDFTRAAPEKP